MSPLYEDCSHKLHRAEYHLDELQHHVGNWFHNYPEKDFDPKRNCFTFRVESVEGLPVEWSLIAGDMLTNFRASLDYLAYDRVGRGREPHRRREISTQFPIVKKLEDFEGQVKGRMPGIEVKHKTIIQSYQPYKWRAARGRHPFALLNTFVNRDKHREPQLVCVYNLHKFRADVVFIHDFAIHRVEPSRIFGIRRKLVPHFEPGAEVARVHGKKTGPYPSVEMGFQGPVSITL